MSSKPLKSPATYNDLREVPDNQVAEMFDGDLFATPRPAPLHANATTVLAASLASAFHRHGPGGWMILFEPELHFGNDVLVPDLAAWRRSRLAEVPAEPFITVAPDWVCEVLSESTEMLDRNKKLRVYARERVAHAWLVDPLRRTLEVLELGSAGWIPVATHEGDGKVRVQPFDAVELALAALWR